MIELGVLKFSPRQRSCRAQGPRGLKARSLANARILFLVVFEGLTSCSPATNPNPDSSGGAPSGGSGSAFPGGGSGGTLASGGASGGVGSSGGSSAGGRTPSAGAGGTTGGTGGTEGSGGAAAGGSDTGGGPSGTGGYPEGVDPNFHVYLLFGQSNMLGIPAPSSADLVENERVRVLSYDDCPNLSRSEGQWATASPPLHGCYNGVGPGDSFGQAMSEAFPEATIGLVPCALPSADIDAFRKGVVSSRRNEYKIPPNNSWPDAYEWLLARAEKAQESGVIRGILMHHGESDTASQAWVDKVEEIVSDLRQDLDLTNVPFLAGELAENACCSSHNSKIAQLPGRIDDTFVVSSAGLGGIPDQTYHFDLAGVRTLGERYAAAMLSAWDEP